MGRFLLDLNNLPKAKKEVILQITSSYSEKSKAAFIKNLVFLGFSTIRQNDIDLASAYISKSVNSSTEKCRIILTNTPILSFLKTFSSQTTRRSCVYAFLYAGISNYMEYMSVLEKSTDIKEINAIEKKMFLCGLGEHFNQKSMISIRVDHQAPQQSKIKAQTESLTNSNIKPISETTNQHTQSEIPSPSSKRTDTENQAKSTKDQSDQKVDFAVKKSKKPIFNIDGV